MKYNRAMRGVSKTEDKHFSKCIRHRDNWRCRSCSVDCIMDQGHLQCCHIYGRANKSTRWAPENCIAMCRTCHERYTKEPIEWAAFCENLLGYEHMEQLKTKKNQIMKTSAALRKQISDHYRIEYKRMVAAQTTDLRGWDD